MHVKSTWGEGGPRGESPSSYLERHAGSGLGTLKSPVFVHCTVRLGPVLVT